LLKIVHTSDWHLGRRLYGRSRYDEHEAFLKWLADVIEKERADVLLVAGDVFDSGTPGNRAQELYYGFLFRVASSGCRHVVIIAGNHDSPSFLDAPRSLLKSLEIHVTGSAADDPGDEVLVLRDTEGEPELVVCAVPFLRDRDVRVAEMGESPAEKERKLVEGIRKHYEAVFDRALELGKEADLDVPMVAMGHLFTAGGRVGEDDGVRELYVGSLVRVAPGMFPRYLDYVALGHLHVPQAAGEAPPVRYSGSPLPMSFGEAGRTKSVCLVEIGDGKPRIGFPEVPVFRELVRIEGDWTVISGTIDSLRERDSDAWLEVIYRGDRVMGDLREKLETALEGSRLEVLRIRNDRIVRSVLGSMREGESLEDLGPEEVFERCLDAHEVPVEQRDELMRAYREIIAGLDDGERETP